MDVDSTVQTARPKHRAGASGRAAGRRRRGRGDRRSGRHRRLQPGHDAAGARPDSRWPWCFPTDTEQVAAVVRACAAAGVPIVPRGAGSGLTGAANAVDGAVTVVMTKMNRILEIDEGNRLAVVQPGVVNLDFRTAVESRGLFYAPDPSSYDWCTIGGNLSTNAGGLCCVKYGVTTDAVLGPGGGAGLRRGAAHRSPHGQGRRRLRPDQADRRLRGHARHHHRGDAGAAAEAGGAAAPWSPPSPAPRTPGAAVTGAIRAGLVPSLLEIMDATCIKAVEAYTGVELLGDGRDPGRAADRPVRRRRRASAAREMDRLERVCLEAGATFSLRHRRPRRGPDAAAGAAGRAAVARAARHLADRRRQRAAHRDRRADRGAASGSRPRSA